MPDRFLFTPDEIWCIQKGMLVCKRMMALRQWGPSGYRQYCADRQMQRFNQRASRDVLRVVRTGVPTADVPEPELRRVYAAARAAYDNAKHFRSDEATARRHAVISAQTMLEFAIGALNHIDADDLPNAFVGEPGFDEDEA